MTDVTVVPTDPWARDQVLAAPPPLELFNRAEILSAADVQTAMRLARLSGCQNPLALLGAAFAVRAPRFGHVFADLAVLQATATDEDGRAVALPDECWPDVDEWKAALQASPMVGAEGHHRPLQLRGAKLYLDRYLQHELEVARAVAIRATAAPSTLSPQVAAALASAFDGNALQHAAAVAASTRRLAVIAGGPGTGKTTTIARAVSLLRGDGDTPSSDQTAGGASGATGLRIAIAAPTGKAAARLGEALRQGQAGADLPTPMTLHRLLGWQARNSTRFKADASNPLPHDLIVVDETSMVSLSLFNRLLDAMRPDARLVLVGDPDQLTAVEAGNVLGDLLAASAGDGPLGPVVTVLTTNYRSDQTVQSLAAAIREGRGDDVVAMLTDPQVEGVSLVAPDRPGDWPRRSGRLIPIADLLATAAQDAIGHAEAGDAHAALQATTAAKVLCAHRRGPDGVRAWNAAVEDWATGLPSYRRQEWYPGRPVMIRRNDPDLDVFNGDIGVVVRLDGRLKLIVDGRQGPPIDVRRLGEVQTVHALTVHKSQGSQFTDVVVVLPDEASPVLTRQLLYTAVTRSSGTVTIVGSEAALRRTISRQVSRASGLADRLGGPLSQPG